jgi:hypothetical protein
MQDYSGRSLVHDRQFERDCERVFGSSMAADAELAQFMFEVGHGIASGTEITSWVTAFVASGRQPCVVIVEAVGEHLLLRALIAIVSSSQLAA